MNRCARGPVRQVSLRALESRAPMDETRVIEESGRRWVVRPQAAQPLLADGWPPQQPDRLTPVKRGHRRSVFRAEAGDQGYFVKVYEAGGLWGGLRRRLGLGPGRREWEALLRARAAGLDVPEPVAVALDAPETLVTREIPGGQRLDEYLFTRYFEPGPGDPPYPGARPPELVAVFRRRRCPPEGTIDPRSLAYRLAALINHLAEADLYLPDLHPGNLLISGPAGRARLSLVDLAEAVFPAPPEAVLEHLLQLEHFFEPIASACERLRCLVRLRELAGGVPAARTVQRATALYRRPFYAHRDHRARRQSKYFRRITACGWRGWATADWAEVIEGLLAEGQADDPLPGSEVTLLKNSRTSCVWRVRLDDGRAVVVKRHHWAARQHVARGLLGRSRSLAAFRRGHALLARGIATARPAAAVDLPQGGRPSDTLLVTEAIEDGEPLSAWLRREPPAADRRHVTRELAVMLRRLHEAGLSHRDLKAPNILVAPAHGPRPCPILVDLDGLKRLGHVSAGRRAQNLMRLSVSLDEWGVARRTDRLRFLRIYLGRPGCPGPLTVLGRHRGSTEAARRLRRWWRRIGRASAAKMEALRRKSSRADAP